MNPDIIFYILVVLMSVVIHEVAHGFAALLQGDHTAEYEGRLTLNPISHLDPIGSVLVPIVTSIAGFPFGWAKPVPFTPYNLRNQRWGELFVAIAGPISNILIALVFGMIIRFSGMGMDSPFIGLSVIIVIVNLGLALFNMMPIPPLDGSKVLFAFLPYSMQKFRNTLEQYSLLFVVILIFLPGFSNLLAFLVTSAFTLITGVTIVGS